VARQSAESLRHSVGRELEQDSDLASRLSRLDRPPGEAVLSRVETLQSVDDGGSLAESGGTTKELKEPCPAKGVGTGTYNAAMQPEGSAHWRDFELVLYRTRVYDRVKHNDIDAQSTLPSSRSEGWSQLSGISLAQISVTSVIKLPLHKHELAAFWSLADDTSIFRTMSHKTGTEWIYRAGTGWVKIEPPKHSSMDRAANSFSWYSHFGTT